MNGIQITYFFRLYSVPVQKLWPGWNRLWIADASLSGYLNSAMIDNDLQLLEWVFIIFKHVGVDHCI